MGIASLINPFLWTRYSKKLIAKIERPYSAGIFTSLESEKRGVRFVEAAEGSVADGNVVKFYWLVDKEDGSIIDAKFQAYGASALLGAAEIACELVVGKNYDQAGRIGADLIDKQVRDRPDDPAFPSETYPLINLVIGAIDKAAEQCTDLPLPSAYVAPPAPTDIGEVVPGGYPGWDELTLKQQINVIEQVLDRDIRPYIALDAGGVTVLDLVRGRDLTISYQGTCTSCYSSVGTTLSYIQQVLRAKVHPEMSVIPEMATDEFTH